MTARLNIVESREIENRYINQQITLLCKDLDSYSQVSNVSLSLGYLSPKQLRMWDLKSSGLPEADIARKLNVTRQTVHQTLDTANLKLTEALKETAKINKIETQKLDPNRSYLLGYSSHFKTQAFITFSAKNGVQIWYRHEGDCKKCNQLKTCRENLLAEAKDRNFLILDDTSKIMPSQLAKVLISKIMEA